jgi:hypothetical protein
MPEQPHNSAEEALQRYAKERRASGGEFALHPATRRLLQGEVARQHGGAKKKPRGGIANWFTAWRMVAASGVLAVLLGLGVWIFSHQPKTISQPTTDLAKLSVQPPAKSSFGRESEVVAPTPEPARPLNREALAPVLREEMKAEAPRSARKDADVNAPKLFAEKPSSLSPAQTATTTTTNTFFADSLATGASDRQRGMNYNGGQNMTANYGISMQAGIANSQQQPSGSAGSLAQNATQSQPADRYYRLGDNRASASSTASPPEQNASALQNNSIVANGNLTANAPGDAPRPDGGTAQKFYKQAPPAVTAPNLAVNNSAAAIGGSQGVSSAGAGKLKEAADEPRNEVLDRFSFEQQGNIVRLIDADGSVYTGAFTDESVDKSASSLALGKQAESLKVMRDAPALPTRSRSFRAAGTNRTVNELVVVDGKVSSVTSPQQLRFLSTSSAAKTKEREVAAQRMPAAASVPTTTPLTRAAGSAGAVTNAPPGTEIEATVRVGRAERGLRAFPAQR